MQELKEGPSFTVPPDTWKDVRNNIVKLGRDHIQPEVMRDLGFFRVSTTGWNDSFFADYVQRPVERGSFGRIKYGVTNMTRSVVRPSKLFPGWRESRQPTGRYKTATMKGLFQEFKRQWHASKNSKLDEMLSNDDRYAAEILQEAANGKSFLYGETYSGNVNASPIAGVVKRGDLSLPINLTMLYTRLHVLFHNYAAARGVSGIWTYAYGVWSGTVLHLEDAFLPSVNLNMGPGRKLWYFVPRSHFKQLQDYYARVGVHPQGDGCKHHFQHKRLAPSVQTLLAEGIPVYYLVQRQGDLIFIDGCVFHEVINWGYGFSQATNILLPSWIHVAEAGLCLRSQRCHEFAYDPEFSAKTLTERLYALLRRLLLQNPTKAELDDLDTAIGRLTSLEWQPARREFSSPGGAIGFGEPLLPEDLSTDLAGLFSCLPADIHADAKSPAALLRQVVRLLPSSPAAERPPVKAPVRKRTHAHAMSMITKDDFLPRRSKRLRDVPESYREA